jgi:hypothetical protein
MAKPERSDPTFAIFVILAFIFVIGVIYATFPSPTAH